MLCVDKNIITPKFLEYFITQIKEVARRVIPQQYPVYLNTYSNIKSTIQKCDIYPKRIMLTKGFRVISKRNDWCLARSKQEYEIINSLTKISRRVYTVSKLEHLFLDFISKDGKEWYRLLVYNIVVSKQNLVLYDSSSVNYADIARHVISSGFCDTMTVHNFNEEKCITSVYHMDTEGVLISLVEHACILPF